MIPFYKPNIYVDAIKEEVLQTLAQGMVTNWGSNTHKLEENISEYLGRPAALTACGTHALTFGLLALEHFGLIPKNAKILVPSFTFYASAHAIIWANMTPIFCDINPETFTIDIDSTNEHFDAIMPVNIFGVHYDTKDLMSKSNKPIIGDNSHGFGGYFHNDRNGSLENIACFSSSITKPMQTIEGGIVAADEAVIDFIKKFRNWGSPSGEYNCIYAGQWSKITEINSIVGLSSMIHLNISVNRKNEIASLYKEKLNDYVEFQTVPQYVKSTYKDFSVLFPTKEIRDTVSTKLDEKRIGNKKYFYPPVHTMTCFKGKYDGLKLPVTNNISDRVLCLPIYDNLTEEDINTVCTAVIEAL